VSARTERQSGRPMTPSVDNAQGQAVGAPAHFDGVNLLFNGGGEASLLLRDGDGKGFDIGKDAGLRWRWCSH
jgi:hypothetical protein